MSTNAIEPRIPVEYPVAVDEQTARILARYDGRPYHWRIALGADIDPFQKNIFWIQEPHFRERYPEGYGREVVYVSSPGTLYDWGDIHGGYQWDFSQRKYEHWEPLPAEALPRERARFVWEWIHQFHDYWADFTLTRNEAGALVLKEADHTRTYPYVIEVTTPRTIP